MTRNDWEKLMHYDKLYKQLRADRDTYEDRLQQVRGRREGRGGEGRGVEHHAMGYLFFVSG